MIYLLETISKQHLKLSKLIMTMVKNGKRSQNIDALIINYQKELIRLNDLYEKFTDEYGNE